MGSRNTGTGGFPMGIGATCAEPGTFGRSGWFRPWRPTPGRFGIHPPASRSFAGSAYSCDGTPSQFEEAMLASLLVLRDVHWSIPPSTFGCSEFYGHPAVISTSIATAQQWGLSANPQTNLCLIYIKLYNRYRISSTPCFHGRNLLMEVLSREMSSDP